jgi:hypothetical protein
MSVFIVARFEPERKTFYTENAEIAEGTEKKSGFLASLGMTILSSPAFRDYLRNG